jgi:hypothetical protein
MTVLKITMTGRSVNAKKKEQVSSYDLDPLMYMRD